MNNKLTRKSDWMNDALASNGAIVSDHIIYARYIGLSEGTTASVRFVGNSRIGFFLILVLLSADDVSASTDLQKASNHIYYLNQNGIPIQTAILCAGERYFLSSEPQALELTTSELIDLFANLHPELAQRHASKVKPINKSINDDFQNFTRQNLSPFIICNDVDALLLPNEKRDRPIIIELKRPEENISGWRPYSADISNYRASLQIAAMCGGDAVTISYNEISDPNFLLLKHSIKPLWQPDAASFAIQNSELWSWKITKEQMTADHPIGDPEGYTGKSPGWLVHWILFDVAKEGKKIQILIDTSRNTAVSLKKS